MKAIRIDEEGWVLDKPSIEGKAITMNLAGLPKGRLTLRIDGEYYQSYYRTKDKLFVRPIQYEKDSS